MTFTRRDIIRYGALSAVAAVLPAQRLLLDRGQAEADPLACVANRVFTGDVTMPEGFTVPAGETWMFDPAASTTVAVGANVVIEGILQMRPAHAGIVHTLRFDGVDETAFVGGHTMTPIATDVGLWVVGLGQLDAQGATRAGWNRSGDDPTWLATDELVSVPYAPGDYWQGFAPFTKGGAVPTTTSPDGTVYPTEIANLTRNVRIEGTPEHRAHVMFVGCQRPQTLRHLAIRWMCPTQDTGRTYWMNGANHQVDAGVPGRYGLHFHHCGDGTRGTIVEGVLIRDTGGRAFVPHLSNGITFTDCVAYGIRDDGFWWDFHDETHDVTYDHCAVFGVAAVPWYEGYSITGFLLGEGTGMTARNCVAVGVSSWAVNGAGFHWPDTASGQNVWTFQNNVAHNNRGTGFGVWQVDYNPHVIDQFTSYHNYHGVHHGSYVNAYTYRDGTVFSNTYDHELQALGAVTFDRIRFAGDALITLHTVPAELPTRYVDCVFGGLIHVAEQGHHGVIRFESSTPATDLTPAKFVVTSMTSTITVHNSDGSTFTVGQP